MSALATIRETDRKDGVIVAHPVLAGEILYKGSTCVLDTTTKTAQSNDGTTVLLSAGDIFAGVVVETVDNTAGGKSVRLYKKGTFLFPFPVGDGMATTKVGLPVYINNTSDDGTVTLTTDAGVDLKIGIVAQLGDTANTAYVQIDNAIGNTAA